MTSPAEQSRNKWAVPTKPEAADKRSSQKRHDTTPAAGGDKAPASRSLLVTRCAAEIEPEVIEWIWPGRIAKGKLGVIAGQPGLGKSFIMQDVAARITRGAAWPDGSGNAPLGSVLIAASEDGIADTIVPRLLRLGADMSKVFFIDGWRHEDHPPDDVGRFVIGDPVSMEAITNHVHDHPDTKLVVLDAADSFLPDGIKTNESAEVRPVLDALTKFTERLGVTVEMVRHFRKEGAASAVNLISGSGAWAQVPRFGMGLIKDDDDETGETRTLVSLKMNIERRPPNLSMTIVDGRVAWSVAADQRDADSLVTPKAARPDDTKVASAAAFLDQLIPAANTVDAAWVFAEGVKAGFPDEKLLQRAAHRLGIQIGVRPKGWKLGEPYLWVRP